VRTYDHVFFINPVKVLSWRVGAVAGNVGGLCLLIFAGRYMVKMSVVANILKSYFSWNYPQVQALII
jgi:hypothetical protein